MEIVPMQRQDMIVMAFALLTPTEMGLVILMKLMAVRIPLHVTSVLMLQKTMDLVIIHAMDVQTLKPVTTILMRQ